jgi:hypothetical protein
VKDAAVLAQRRRQLRLRAAQQRDELAQAFAPLLQVAHTVDRVAAGARWVGNRPQIFVGAAVAVAVLGVLFFTRRPVRLVRLGFLAWRAWRWVRFLPLALRLPIRFP